MSMQDTYEKLRKMREERYNELLAMVKEAHPEVNYSSAKVCMDDFELRVYPDNLHYLIAKSYPRNVYRRKTELGIFIELAVEAGRGYVLREESKFEVTLVMPCLMDEVKVIHFDRETGRQRKHRRHFLKVHSNSKGHYIKLGRARYYLPAEWWVAK